MKIIKNISDLRKLKNAGVLEKEYLDLIKRYFKQLHKTLGDGCSIEEFRLGAAPTSKFIPLTFSDCLQL